MNAGRPLEFDPDAALAAAMRLFWSQGYKATSLQDLLGQMGIARSSFYQKFRSKRGLFISAVERYRDALVADLRDRLATSKSGLAFLRDMLASVADDAQGKNRHRGCLVFNSAAEFGQSDAQVAATVATSIDAFASVFADAVRRAQREGDIDPGEDPDLLGRHMVCSMSGLRTLAKAGAKPREILDLAEISISALN